MYVRFGGERLETYRSNAARRWALTLLYTAIAPVPLSTFAGEPTQNVGKSYIGELVFNMLVLVGAVKMADRVVREMMGL